MASRAMSVPRLKAVSEDSMHVAYTLPSDATHVTIRMRAVGKEWRVIDATTGQLDEVGTAFAASEDCTVSGLNAETAYEATVKTKGGAGWGSWSAVSKSLRLASHRPLAAGVPKLVPMSEDSIEVQYAAMPGVTSVCAWMREVGKARWMQADATKGDTLVEPPAVDVYRPTAKIVVKGLTPGASYEAKISAHNKMGYGPHSPASPAVCIADHRPPAPGAPKLVPVSEDSIEVQYAAMPGVTSVCVWMREVGKAWMQADATKGDTLVEPPAVDVYGPTAKIVVKGLTPGASYEAKISARNKMGYGRPASPISPAITLEDTSAPVVTGSSSWEDRDQALRKRSIDVESGNRAAGSTTVEAVKQESKVAKVQRARR